MGVSARTLNAMKDSVADDTDLVLQAIEDPAKFQILYLHWVTPVYQYLFSRTGNHQDAEDITSQVFLRAFQAFPRYEHRGLFPAWLFSIVRSQVAGRWRKRQPEVALAAAQDAGVSTDMLGDIFQQAENDRLARVIAARPAEDQELIRLRYIAELKFADIAQVLGKNEDAVKKSLYRLLADLRAQMEANHE